MWAWRVEERRMKKREKVGWGKGVFIPFQWLKAREVGELVTILTTREGN